ncbi:MAG: hypothetical protein II584_04645 [Treponema sp.]|nr:hypothetical protein [Treponema sp.]
MEMIEKKELTVETASAPNPRDAYLRALEKKSDKILSLLNKKDEYYNPSGEQLYDITENFFRGEKIDRDIFDEMNGEGCPILSFSDEVLEQVYAKCEKIALDAGGVFFRTARTAALEEKYLLQKERVDDIIQKCAGLKKEMSDENFSLMLDLIEFNSSQKSMESCIALLKSAAEKARKSLSPKGFLFKKNVSESEREKHLCAFEKSASKFFETLSHIVEGCIKNGRCDFYDRVSPNSIEEIFRLLDEMKRNYGREEMNGKVLNVSCEEFLLQFINYYVTVTQLRKDSENSSFAPISNWKLNEAFRILGEYSSNPVIQFQLIEKYSKERDGNMIYFPFEIITGILCKSSSGWDLNKKCLDVVFTVASSRPDEKSRIEKLITQVVTDPSRDERVRMEAFERYFELTKSDLQSLVPWVRDSIIPDVFSGKYSRIAVSIARKILGLVATEGADDGLDASREKCIDYLGKNYEEDPLEILNVIKNFLCLQSCRNTVLKEKIYDRFYAAFEDDCAKKIHFNREILDGLKDDSESRTFLCHVCYSTLDMAGKFSDAQKADLKEALNYLLGLLNSDEDSVVVMDVLLKFMLSGKESSLAREAVSKICGFGNRNSRKLCFSLIDGICRKNERLEGEYHASLLKTALDTLLDMKPEKNLDVDRKFLSFLAIDFSTDEFSLADYGKKALNYIWQKNENSSPLWKDIKLDYINTVSKCRSVEILQFAFEKACR